MLRAGALLAAITILVAACDPLDESGGVPPGLALPTPVVDPAVRGAETFSQALTLLSENFPEGADTSRLVAASQRGAWLALAQAGVPPTDFDLPPANARMAETPQQMRQRYGQLLTRYSSKIEADTLSHEMIRKMADSLDDCHTGFLSPRQAEEHARRLAGATRFGGVGVILRRTTDNNGFAVVEVFENGPAHQAGLKRGDVVTEVNGESLLGLGIEQVVALVRGPEGTAVTLGILRAGLARQFQITRAQVAAPFIVHRLLPENVGYVHLYSFPQPLTDQLDGALREFERRQVAGLVVDLRDNSGGSLDVVTKTASRFVKQGPLFQSIAPGGQRTVYNADGSAWSLGRPIVVLVNGGTGSGGEIVAAAMQEHNSARVIGTTTSGCVSTGQMFPLPDGSALEVAVSRVVTGVRGAPLNKVGVKPDEVVQIGVDDLANDRDPQLGRAVELILRG